MNCLFCKITRREIPSELIYEDGEAVAFRDINPQAPVHILIVPKRHIEKHADLSTAEKALMGHLHEVARVLAVKEKLGDYRLVLNNGAGAGQSVWHLHLHLLSGRAFSWPPG